MVSTVDYFYPLVDDPYMMGKIGCANVLSDLYSFGVVDCDNILMILAASTDFTAEERRIVSRQIIEGFSDLATEAGTSITGGQTVLNPWPIIGGSATSVCREEDFIMPVNAVAGDVLVLTKPLGIQVAVNLNQWKYKEEQWQIVKDIITKEEVTRAYDTAMYSMARLNRTAAKLMHKYGAHAATDVTGFGILGHATNLAGNQKASVNFIIETLPFIRSMKAVDDHLQSFNLMKGTAAETSGGLLIALPLDKAELFCKEIEEIDKWPAWIVGKVVESSTDRSHNTCHFSTNLKVIEF